jgi:hypothetical protein
MSRIKILIIAAITFLPYTSSTKLRDALLDCSSNNAKGEVITLRGTIPGDSAEFYLVFKVGDKKIEIANRKTENDISVVNNWKHSVFALSVLSENGYSDIVMYAIPRSARVKKTEEGNRVGFAAIVEQAPIPGYDGPLTYSAFLHDIKMKCIWKYPN